MVGVASPLRRVPGAVSFYAAFAAGALAAGLVLALILVPTSLALAGLPERARGTLFAGGVAAFAALDVLGRTPQVRRQVPQRLGLQGLPFGPLGFVYGLDVGLHVTTLKVSSLIWVVILGSVLVGDDRSVIVTLLTLAAVEAAAITLLSAFDQRAVTDLRFWGGGAGTWMRSAQKLGAAVAIASLAWIMVTMPGLWS